MKKTAITEFLKDASRAKSIQKHYNAIGRWVKEDPDAIVELFDQIPKDQATFLKHWQFRGLYEQVISLACMAKGPRYVALGHTMFMAVDSTLHKRKIASILASCQDPDTLIAELHKRGPSGLLVLAMHELVSRGEDLAKHACAQALVQYNATSDFKALALYPMPQEQDNTFPTYRPNATSTSHAFGSWQNQPYQGVDMAYTGNIAFERNKALESGLSHWTKQSGGVVVGYTGRTIDPIAPKALATFLPAFGTATGIRIKKLDSTGAYCQMFDAISKGAAYSVGEYGAMGRLMAWSTIGHMVGLADYDTNQKISDTMDAYDWYAFNTDTWFINEWCDFGIFCYDQKTGAFGLLACTDTD